MGPGFAKPYKARNTEIELIPLRVLVTIKEP